MTTRRELDPRVAAQLPAASPASAMGGKATLYYKDDLCAGKIRRIVVKAWRVTVAPMAQHAAAVFVDFTPKGCRRDRSVIETFNPSVLILEGEGPEPPSMWDESTTRVAADGTVTGKSRYRSQDPRWRSDFDALIAATPGLRIVADYRSGGPFRRA